VPRVILLLFILGLIAVAIRQMASAMALPGGDTGSLRPDFPERPRDIPHWLHGVLVDTWAAESEGWALDRVRRVEERLQAGRPPGERRETVILWAPETSAFTYPGRHLYLSRRLLERARDDETIAMVLTHEIAHHDLGHLPDAGEWERQMESMGSAVAAPLVFLMQRRLAGPEREADADAHGLNLCLAAGYDPYRCLQLFDLLENAALDAGDVEGVFGPVAAIDAELAGEAAWRVELRTWMWERARGYPSLRERKARLRATIAKAEAAQDEGIVR
jgi:hypothetical protein